MRPDLAKLTTEKERRGGAYATNKKYGGRVRIVHNPNHDYENEVGGFHSSSRRRHHNCKEFSDVLGPLRGVLRKNVGRPWDAVYSEFCKVLDRRSNAGIHIFSHLVGFQSGLGGEVKIKGLYEEDGKVYEHQPPGWRHKKTEVTDFYVHPRTGLLCWKPWRYGNNNWKIEPKIKALREGEVDINGNQYRMINGLWFQTWQEKKYTRDFILLPGIQDKEPRWYQENGYVLRNDRGLKLWGKWSEPRVYHTVGKQRSLNSKEIKMVKKARDQQIEELESELS